MGSLRLGQGGAPDTPWLPNQLQGGGRGQGRAGEEGQEEVTARVSLGLLQINASSALYQLSRERK